LAAVVERSRTSREERLEKEEADRRTEAERQAKDQAEKTAREAALRAAILDKALKEENPSPQGGRSRHPPRSLACDRGNPRSDYRRRVVFHRPQSVE
jgi:hypothetical protein